MTFRARISFVMLLVAGATLGAFFVLRTLRGHDPAFEQAVVLGKTSLHLDSSKNETATLKTLDLQGSTWIMTFVVNPSGYMATVVTDDRGVILKSMKRS